MELYEEYKEEVIKELKRLAGEDKVQLLTVQKNNGVELDGVTIRAEKETMTPTLYLNDYYTSYQNGKSISEIAELIYQMHQAFQCRNPDAAQYFSDFAQINDRIICKLIHKEQNETLLKKIPYIEFLDLAIVFYCLVDQEEIGFSTMLIHHNHLEIWEQSLETLYPLALENTKEQMGIQLKTMYDTIQDLSEGPISEEVDSSEEASMRSMFVLTNNMRMYGAVCIVFPEVLVEAAEMFGGDFYILPSSVHEVILVSIPIAGEGQVLAKMVKEINEGYVAREEILSDEIYYYSKKDKCINTYMVY